jgi:hypothetical protein
MALNMSGSRLPPENLAYGFISIPAGAGCAWLCEAVEQDIVTSFRDDNLCATLHFSKSEEDVELFIAALADHRAKFSQSFLVLSD